MQYIVTWLHVFVLSGNIYGGCYCPRNHARALYVIVTSSTYRWWVWVVVAASIAGVLALVGFAFYTYCRRKRAERSAASQMAANQNGAPGPQPYGSDGPPSQYGGNVPPPQYGGSVPPPQYGGNGPPPQYGGNAPPAQYGAPGHAPQFGPHSSAPSTVPGYPVYSPQT